MHGSYNCCRNDISSLWMVQKAVDFVRVNFNHTQGAAKQSLATDHRNHSYQIYIKVQKKLNLA